MVRKILDTMYLGAGVISALFLIAILILIVIQMSARWFGFTFPGGSNYAGYCMAGSSFFALAYALNRGAHIRVGLFLAALGPYRRYGELWCWAVAAFLSTYFAYYAVKTVQVSRQINDISQGLDATPLWIPQLLMAAGTILLAIAVWDNLIRMLFAGEDNVRAEGVQDH